MAQSTDGQICYGIMFGEGYEFPWETEGDGDIEEWWVFTVQGFKPSVEIYDNEGNYINGIKPPEAQIKAYYSEKRAFKEAAPKLPIEMVNYCSGECPMYILAVPSTVMSASRGYPKSFTPENLTVSEDERSALLKFCEDHGIESTSEPQWWLSSYWG